MLKRIVMGGFAAVAVLLAGCAEDEKAVEVVEETEIVEKVVQAEEPVVDAYWSQPIDSEICQTVGECRDLGDTYGSEHFSSFSGTFKDRNHMSYLHIGTVDNESVLAGDDRENEDLIIARYEILDDEIVLTSGEESDLFNRIADVVLALYDRDKINLRILEFRENVYPRVDIYEGKLVMPSNLIPHWLQSATVSILIHEYGHFLTWNETDFVSSDTCPADQYYLKPYGECYNADSYMSLYYQAFLTEYEEEWLHVGYKTVEERIAFYEENKESFLTTYATVHPLEDIAESFSFFMLTPYNDSPQTIPEEKINFFYQFPELVEYRAFVLKELNDRKEETFSFY